jgi:hypothetical protein
MTTQGERFLMKHFALFLFFLMPILGLSQKFSLGLKAAPLVSWAAFGDKDEKQKFSRGISSGYYAGALIMFPMKEQFDFIAEAAYSHKGRKMRFQNESWTNKSVYTFTDVTMLLRKSFDFRLRKNVISQWYVNIGPEVSYWINGKGSVYVDGPKYPYKMAFNKEHDASFTTMYMNNVNRWLFGLAIGAGIKAPLSDNQHVGVELRFISGHTFMGKKDSSYIEILTFEDTMLTNLKVLYMNFTYSVDLDLRKSRKGKSTLDKKIKTKKRR